MDSGFSSYGYAAWTVDWLGRRDRALDESVRASQIDRTSTNPNLVMMLANADLIHQFRRELDTTLAKETIIRLADQLGMGPIVRLSVETHSRRGKPHLALGRASEAETSWRRAIEVARLQCTKTLDLRAATSLARLFRDQGNRLRPATFSCRSTTGSPRGRQR